MTSTATPPSSKSDPASPPASPGSPGPWRPGEIAVILGIVAVFLAIGLWQYRERRHISEVESFRDDMGTIALALNTYQNEQGVFPVPDFGPDHSASYLAGRFPSSLTTPIAYINRLPRDRYESPDAPPGFHYMRRNDKATTGGDPVLDGFVLSQIGEPAHDVDYVIWSPGPDLDTDTVEDASGAIRSMAYDPTNGARSNGDLLFWGPAIGVRRNPYAGTSAAGAGDLR